MKRCLGWFFGALAGGMATLPLAAQSVDTTSSRAEQARLFRGSAPLRESTDPQTQVVGDQVPASPGDADLGEQVILKRREKMQPFTLLATASGFYTTNAALTDRNTVEDFFAVGEVGVTYQRPILAALLGEITLRQAIFRYKEFNELDFESLNAGAGLTYVIRPLWNLAVTARYNYNRLTDGSEHHEFFKNQTLTLGLLKTFQFSRAHYGYLGYASVLGWSDPVAPQRDEHGFYAGYHVNFTRALSSDFFYRIARFDYVNGREDLNQTMAASLKCDLTRWLSLTASASAGFNRSDREVFDYDVVNLGASISGSISF